MKNIRGWNDSDDGDDPLLDEDDFDIPTVEGWL